MEHINLKKLTQMTSRYRAHLVNSLSGFKSANLIGTADKDGQTNLAIFSSVFHLGASPALVGFIMRPDSVERHTLDNIKQTKSYTINQVDKSMVYAAHQTSARYQKSECEFHETGLTPMHTQDVHAPFVEESQLKYSLELKQVVSIEQNGTLMVIGEITNIYVANGIMQQDGFIDIEAIETVAISGLDSYHTTNRLSRLSYAKPESEPKSIPIYGI